MTRRKQTSFILTMMIMLFAIGILSEKTFAEIKNCNLTLGAEYIQDVISDKGDIHVYPVNLTSSGTLTVSFQGWSIERAYYQLQDSTQETQFYKTYVYNSSETNPKTNSQSKYLEKGSYLIRILPNGKAGTYKIKASFSPAGNTETEPNNGFDTAMTLPANTTVTGLISENDTLDFYTFEVPSKQKITVTYKGMISQSYYSIWDYEFNKLKSTYVYSASEASPKTSYYEAELDKGTYYIKIEPNYSSRGRYQLRLEGQNFNTSDTPSTPAPSQTPSAPSTPSVPASSVPKKVESTDKIIKGSGTGKVVFIDFLGTKIIKGKKVSLGSKTKILPANAANKKVQWISSDPDVATVSSSGVVTAKSCGRVYITAIAADGGGASTTRTFYVRPKKMKKASVSSPGKKRIRVKWKKVSGVSKYQIAVSKLKNFSKRTMKNMKQSKKSYTFTSMKSGQVYYVRMRAIYKVNSKKTLYGPWSTAVKVKCK